MTDLTARQTYNCNVGGNYDYPRLDGPARYNPPCAAPAAFRYRPADPANPNWNGGHWNHRCATHIHWLDSGMEWAIEPVPSRQADGL